MSRFLRAIVVFGLVVVITSCADVPTGAPIPTSPPLTNPPVRITASTDPPLTSTTTPGATSTTVDEATSTTGLPTTVPSPGPVALPDVFGHRHEEAVGQLQGLGFAVIAYDVCSGSVAQGEVRQVISRDGDYETELVGKSGVTEEGMAVPFGATVEVKIGTGWACG